MIGPGIKGAYGIRRRYSPDEAKTPGLANIKNAARMQEQVAQQHYSPFLHSPGEHTPAERDMSPDGKRDEEREDARMRHMTERAISTILSRKTSAKMRAHRVQKPACVRLQSRRIPCLPSPSAETSRWVFSRVRISMC